MGQDEIEISAKAWVGIAIGTFLIGAIIFAQFEDPGGFAFIGSFVGGLLASLLIWGMTSVGYEHTRK